jgi:hypothetical protein
MTSLIIVFPTAYAVGYKYIAPTGLQNTIFSYVALTLTNTHPLPQAVLTLMFHSYLSATMGSTFAARRAGT